MRLPLLALTVALAASASAQTAPADTLARLDAEIARTEAALATLDAEALTTRQALSRLDAGKDSLDAARSAFQDEIRAYRAAAAALTEESARVRATYERLRGGGPEAEMAAYTRDAAALRTEGDRLRAEAARLNAREAALNERFRLYVADVREAAEAGRRMSIERRRLAEVAATLAARRARLGAAE